MNVLYVFADTPQETNCSRWNCWIPAEAINRTEEHKASYFHISKFIQNDEEIQRICQASDIIVIERNFFGDTLTMMQYWKVRGKTIVAIFDDAYQIMHPENVSYRFWTYGEMNVQDEKGNKKIVNMNPPPLEQFKWGLRIAKATQVVSKALADDWRPYSNTFVVNNYLPIEKYMNVEPLFPHDEKNIVIGWCGSMSHVSSFTDSGIMPALRKVCKRYPNVTVMLTGDKRNYDNLEVPVSQKKYQDFVPPEQWEKLVKSLDIGLAPLSGEYDKRRSWVKVLEYMALKIPWIASDYPTYSALKEGDYGVLVKNDQWEWEKKLSHMVENYSTYKQKAEDEGYRFALKQSSDNNIRNTLAIYQKLIDSPYP
jgi:glycosyltransferase involved in cell wall biosynthesis